jgi:voltage-gated potassium channel
MSDSPAGGGPAAAPGASEFRGRVRRSILAFAAVLVVYYAAPVGEFPSVPGLVLSVVGLLAGMGLLAWLAVRQVARISRRAPGDESVRLEGLVLLLFVAEPLFALGFYALERADPGEFAELSTKTDALYFATSTVATVGFGDVHAIGQLARALVTVQLAFNLVFIAALGSVLSHQIRERAAARRTADGGEGDRSAG